MISRICLFLYLLLTLPLSAQRQMETLGRGVVAVRSSSTQVYVGWRLLGTDPGDIGFKPIATSVGKLGVLVCWDQWYPEAARLMALAGADLLLYPTAIGWNPDDAQDEQMRQLDAWITIQRSHAVANGLPVLSCNRIGHEPDPSPNTQGILFWGNSFVVGPQGEFLDHANDKESRLLIVELEHQRTEDVRRIWPFLRDRRIDEYDGLVKRYLD